MSTMKRNPTKYPGVFYIDGTGAGGKAERIFYIMYRRDGKKIEERVGRQFQDDMTPARAAQIRTRRIEGDELPNRERRKAKECSAINIGMVYAEYQAASMRRAFTDIRVNQHYRQYLEKTYAARHPSTITQKDFDIIIRQMMDDGKAPQTIRHITGLLHRILKHAVKSGYCQMPQLELKLPQLNNEKTEDLTPEELQRLLAAMDEDTHPYAGRLMKMALFTGMRAGELFRLEWTDIDVERGFIWLRNPKGGKDKRIPLNETVKAHLETVPKIKNSPYVFPADDGNMRTTIAKPVARIRDKAGLSKDFRPLHGLRHVFASTLASSGLVDMYTLQKLMTHASPQMTQRYAHLRDEAFKKGADIAGNIFGNLDTQKPG